MSDSQESRNNVKASNMDGLGTSNRSFPGEKSFQQECPRFRDGDPSQARMAHELEVSKNFLVHEHEVCMLNNASSFQDSNKKLLEGKENPLSNGRTQPISYPGGAESWNWAKNNGEQEKVRALRQQLQEIQEGLAGTGHASSSIFKSTATAFGKVGPQAGSLPTIDFVSRSRGEIGPWSSAQLMDVVHSMDSTVPMLLAGFPSHLKGATQMFVSQNNPSDERAGNVASSSEILQQPGMPEQHMQREVHLQKQQEARKKRKMLIDEQKQQKKAKEDDRSPLCSGSTGTIFRRPGSSQWPRALEVQTREQTVPSSLDHNGDPEQLIEAFPASQVLDQTIKDAGVRTEESNAGRIGLQEDRVGATINYIQKLRGEEAAITPFSNCHTILLPGSTDNNHSNTCVEKLEEENHESALFKSTQEELSPIVVQHLQSQSGTMKPGIVATAVSTVKPSLCGSMPPSESKLQHQGIESDAFTSPIAAVEASQDFHATVSTISGSATKLSVGEDISHEDTASQLPRDVQDESTSPGKDPLELPGRSGKPENHSSLPSENSNVKGVLGVWQLGTTRGIPGMEILSREPYNLQPGIAVGQTFGGTGSSPDLPWVSSPNLNGKAVSGVVYRLVHGSIRIVCACHGKHMTPVEFSKHGASLDLPDKDVSLVMGTFSDGTEATSAKL
ncbi:hypothetical protein O6H91_04G037100 [Diphasiastrum complanatum]|nr:hypothetical protein O6H91_04G037100 [Diphasiastrum complanatum]